MKEKRSVTYRMWRLRGVPGTPQQVRGRQKAGDLGSGDPLLLGLKAGPGGFVCSPFIGESKPISVSVKHRKRNSRWPKRTELPKISNTKAP